jgi:hypothetical protein
MPAVIACSVYLAAAIAATLWTGRTLHRNGRVFLAQAFAGDMRLADSASRLLAAGFYLVNLGWMAQSLSGGGTIGNASLAVQFIAGKLGGSLLLLGCLHFGGLYLLNRLVRPRHDRLSASSQSDAWLPADRPLGKVLE